jgi:Protein of unknown function (DUF2490)
MSANVACIYLNDMTNKLKCTALGAALLLVCRAHADTIEDGRYWFAVNATGHTAVDNLRWYAELQPRWRYEGAQFDQVLLRPALSYALNEQASVWLGYAYVVSHPDGKPSFDEHRYWQQFLYNFSPIHSVSIQSRTRIEQRHLEDSSDTGHKIRQLLRLTLPSQLSPSLQWVVYDEYFVNLNDTDYGAVRGFDQNRAFVGVNWALNPTARVEVGYLNQYVNRHQNIDLENHVFSTTLMLKF